MWEKYAARAWDICAALANTASATVSYSQVEVEVGYRQEGPYAPFHGTKATEFLTLIADYCQEHRLPYLSLMVRRKNGGYGEKILGYLANDVEAELTAVRDFDWSQISNPFTDEQVIEEARGLLEGGEAAALSLARSQNRGYRQKVFREALLKAYRGRCAICSIQHPALLEAAHLKPWRDATEVERVDVRNGMLLCRNHHAALDRGFWAVNLKKDGAYSVSTVVIGSARPLGMEKLYTDALRLPKRPEWQPKTEWLLLKRR